MYGLSRAAVYGLSRAGVIIIAAIRRILAADRALPWLCHRGD